MSATLNQSAAHSGVRTARRTVPIVLAGLVAAASAAVATELFGLAARAIGVTMAAGWRMR